MKKSIYSTLLIGASLCIGCAASKPDALYHAESKLQQAKRDDFTYQNAPLKIREAEETLASAQNVWREEEDVKRSSALALLAEEQIDGAVLHARQSALQELHSDIEQKEELIEKDRELQEVKEDSRELYKTATHYQSRSQRLEQERVALLKELQAKETEKGFEITLGSDVLFEVDKSQLKPGGERSLQPLANYLEEHPDVAVRIEGHTDSMGEEAYNERLSKMRADAVKEFLIAKGISPSQLEAKGMGEGFPIASNESTAGRLQNRRVEIVVAEG